MTGSGPERNGKTPVSVEELMERLRKEQEAAQKPRFLTKEERQALALKQRMEEVERARKQHELEQERRDQFIKAARKPLRSDGGKEPMPAEGAVLLNETDKRAIRERYMGAVDTQPKKLRRFTERRFRFDWEDSDDTSANAAPLLAKQAAEKRRPAVKKGGFDERHWSEKEVEEMRERDWRIFKEDFNISAQGGSIPHPIRHWHEAALPGDILHIVDRIGYKHPTPIQRQAIPLLLQSRDVIGVAQTGSGKTAAFVLPMLEYIKRLPKLCEKNALDGPYGLVLVPTRELAQQIEQETRKFTKPLGFNCVSIVGGHSLAEQSFHMRNGVEIVIATPGRLRDCLEQHVLVLNQCYSVVLDEADRMIAMNFEDDLKFILGSLPVDTFKPDSEAAEDASFLLQRRFRQTVMFSATMPPAVEKLAKLYLRRPALVTIGQAGQAVESVEQRVEMISEERKANRLVEILASGEFAAPMIIFVNQKKTVDFLYRRLDALGYKVTSLHGGKGQDQREAALLQLRSGSREILIATDVAGRGIDIKDVSLVLNYDMAKSIEDYVHRIGRTGRAGKSGVAITFLTANDTEVYYDLRMLLQKSSRNTVPPELTAHEASRVKPGTVTQKRKHEETIYAYGI